MPGVPATGLEPPDEFQRTALGRKETNMHTPPTQIIAELQRQAKRCETIAQDKTQESLTGASSDKEKNELEAKEWLVKSKVWLEAEVVVRRFV